MILKVCGITNQGDASAAIDAGATAIGFNFYAKSPRYVRPETAGAISTPGALRVGVFVNEAPERIEEIARLALLDVAQLHGDEGAADFPQLLGLLEEQAYRGYFTIEREQARDPMFEISQAVKYLRDF